MVKSDVRASRNRTLRVSASERRTLRQRLLFPASDQPLSLHAVQDRLLIGDTTKILPCLPQQIADLIILDPPYNLSRNYHGHRFVEKSQQAYADYLRSWFSAVVSLLKPDGSLYCCGDWRSSATLQQLLCEHLTIRNRITWQREKGRGARSNWKNAMEDIWYAVADVRRCYFDVNAVKVRRRVLAPYRDNGTPKQWKQTSAGRFRDTCPSNLWDDLSVPYWSMPENTDHPTQKPEKLIARLVLASCPEGGLVLDPFCGSGTTAVVCRKLNRHFIGIEINPEYGIWAQKRLDLARVDPAIQGFRDGVFWERNTFAEQKKCPSGK